jgi:hypothetical protein
VLLLTTLSPVLAVVDLVSLGVYVYLHVKTNGFEAGRPAYHQAAMGEVVVGAANGLLLSLGGVVIVIGVVLAVIAMILAIFIGLGSLGGSSSN